MTRASIKEFLMQITQADKDTLASRWMPEILCEMIDNTTDEDLLGLLEHRVCENCVFLHKPDLTENIYRCWEGVSTIEEVEIELDFGCIKFSKGEQDAV